MGADWIELIKDKQGDLSSIWVRRSSIIQVEQGHTAILITLVTGDTVKVNMDLQQLLLKLFSNAN